MPDVQPLRDSESVIKDNEGVVGGRPEEGENQLIEKVVGTPDPVEHKPNYAADRKAQADLADRAKKRAEARAKAQKDGTVYEDPFGDDFSTSKGFDSNWKKALEEIKDNPGAEFRLELAHSDTEQVCDELTKLGRSYRDYRPTDIASPHIVEVLPARNIAGTRGFDLLGR